MHEPYVNILKFAGVWTYISGVHVFWAPVGVKPCLESSDSFSVILHNIQPVYYYALRLTVAHMKF